MDRNKLSRIEQIAEERRQNFKLQDLRNQVKNLALVENEEIKDNDNDRNRLA